LEPANRTPSEREKVTNVYQQQQEMFSKSKKTRITKDGVSERAREGERAAHGRCVDDSAPDAGFDL